MPTGTTIEPRVSLGSAGSDIQLANHGLSPDLALQQVLSSVRHPTSTSRNATVPRVGGSASRHPTQTVPDCFKRLKQRSHRLPPYRG